MDDDRIPSSSPISTFNVVLPCLLLTVAHRLLGQSAGKQELDSKTVPRLPPTSEGPLVHGRHRGPEDHRSIRISHSGSKTRYKGDTMVCRILVFMWSFGALRQPTPTQDQPGTSSTTREASPAVQKGKTHAFSLCASAPKRHTQNGLEAKATMR